MKDLRVKAETYAAIATATIYPFRSTGKRQTDGSWIVQIEDDTYERLLSVSLPGETPDDAILRVITLSHSQPH